MTITSSDPRHAFVCYRTEDTLAVADRLAVELQRALEIEVFIDHRSLDGGDRWPDRLRREVERSEVVLILVGPRWLGLQTSDGIRRLDDPDDWVRQEIEFAIAAKRIIIPLLVDGAAPIEKRALRTVPQIEALAEAQAVPLATKQWNLHFDAVVALLTKYGFRRNQRGDAPTVNLSEVRLVGGAAVAETVAMVFVDLMRLLFVASGGVARSANEHRYAAFIAIAERHVADLKSSIVQFASALDAAAHHRLVLLQRHFSFMLDRLRNGLDPREDMSECWRMIRQTRNEVDQFCSSVMAEPYGRLRETIERVLHDTGRHEQVLTGLPLDNIWRHRLATQSRVLEEHRNAGDTTIWSIANDMDQRFGVAYFIIDSLLLE
jgi:TIR domain